MTSCSLSLEDIFFFLKPSITLFRMVPFLTAHLVLMHTHFLHHKASFQGQTGFWSILLSTVHNRWLTSVIESIDRVMLKAQKFGHIVNEPTAQRQTHFSTNSVFFITPTLFALFTFLLFLSLFLFSLNLNALIQNSDVKRAHRFPALQELCLSWVKANRTLWHAVDHTTSYFLGNYDSFP